jgi:hypothetical protein
MYLLVMFAAQPNEVAVGLPPQTVVSFMVKLNVRLFTADVAFLRVRLAESAPTQSPVFAIQKSPVTREAEFAQKFTKVGTPHPVLSTKRNGNPRWVAVSSVQTFVYPSQILNCTRSSRLTVISTKLPNNIRNSEPV